MAKTRIIIADTDVNYIIPLQLKFVEEFFDKVDIEIITDKNYFETLFSSPQKADILIISEELYDSSLQRHNLRYIYLMTEQYEEDQTDELNINRIFKYTSIKEIFNEITGKSDEVLNVVVSEKKEPQIVLVCSASGGTGKTSLATAISACLTKNYKKVLYINASHLQYFQRVLNNTSPITLGDVYTKLINADENIYYEIKHVLRKEIFSYLPPFKAALISLGIKFSVYYKIALAAKKSQEYDFIVIDSDAPFDEDAVELLNIANRVVVVTEQSFASVYATNIFVSSINGATGDKYVFVCNNFDNEKENALISPSVKMKFSVNDYISHKNHFEQLSCDEMSNDSEIQKVSFLVL